MDPKTKGFIELKKSKKIKKVILCSGKIYFDLLEAREKMKKNDLLALCHSINIEITSNTLKELIIKNIREKYKKEYLEKLNRELNLESINQIKTDLFET